MKKFGMWIALLIRNPQSAVRNSLGNPQSAIRNRRGSVLILVLWMIIVLGIVGISYTASVRTQLQTARLARGRHVAAWAARAGVERAMADLMQTDLTALTDLDPLLDDEVSYLNQPVGEALYTLIGAPDAEGLPRYGLIDESSRISINRASETMLMSLDGVTAEMAESLLDWRDADDEPLPEGAERDFYEALPFPYPPKNGPLDSVRELMRIKGWGSVFDMAYPDPYKRFLPEGPIDSITALTGGPSEEGATTGVAPGEEGSGAGGGMAGGGDIATATPEPQQTGASGTEALTNSGEITLDQPSALAIINSLTAWSAAPTTNPDGTDKVNISEASENELTAGIPGLSRDEAQAIVAWQKGQGFRGEADLLRVTQPQNNDSSGNNNKRSGSGGKQAGSGQSGNGQTVFTLQRVGEIIDYCTTRQLRQGGVATGRININTAAREVLMMIPGMTEELADAIIAQRESEGAFTKPGDLATLAEMDSNSFRRVYPWICASTTRFHVMSQGRDPDSGAAITVEAVLAFDDQQQVSVIYWREF